MSADLFFIFQSRARQEDPEQARLKQKAKEVRNLLCMWFNLVFYVGSNNAQDLNTFS